MTIKNWFEELKSDLPAPGGGGVAAMSGANGIALIMMVANHTVGKAKYADFEELNRDTIDECEVLLQRMIDGIGNDKVAFEKVTNAYGLPRSTDEEKTERSRIIAEASVGAAEAPLAVMRDAVRGLELSHGCYFFAFFCEIAIQCFYLFFICHILGQFYLFALYLG